MHMEMRILCKTLIGKHEWYTDHLEDNIKMDSHGS
jgi:hypothetical protein